MLTLGAVVPIAGGRRVVLSRVIGEGSQGTVYEATPTDGGERVALKWYFPHTASLDQRGAIAELVERGAPSPRFLWPSELVDVEAATGFGYVMPLRPDRYAGLVELLNGKVDVPFSVVTRLCIELADSFLLLHSEGLCYRDISFSNVFFDPDSGVPLICDNDNVGVDGKGPVRVLGTRRFMAPEIVRREASPSTATDLYSLAVVLFYVLMMGHPLVGRRELEFGCWDEEAESVLFGREPRFVFDPADRSNEPDPSLHAAVSRNWTLYPAGIRDLFVQAFTRGLTDPRNGRVRESVWRAALARLYDSIVACPTCAKQNYAPEGSATRPCWFCDNAVRVQEWLDIDGARVVLSIGTVLSAHHLRHDYDFDTRVGEVVSHPQRPGVQGLRNLTDRAWSVTLPDGEIATVEPERSVRVGADTVIDFGPVTGTIRG